MKLNTPLLFIFAGILYGIHTRADQHITVVIPSYNNAACYQTNLESALSQDYPNYDIIYIDDASTDGTGELVKDFIATHTCAQQITLIENKYNRKALANIFKAVHMCPNDDLIVVLDGDDSFAHNYVLSYYKNLFKTQDVWMAYAQYINVPEELAIALKIPVLGYAKPTPPNLIESGNYRTFTGWCWSGLRAFYAGLFKKIKIEDMIFRHGEYLGKFFPTSYDGAIMYPMLEMCGTHFAHVPDILLHRNIDTPLNDFKLYQKLQSECGKILRSLKPYKRLETAPIYNFARGKADLIIIASDNNIERILEEQDLNAFDNMYILPKPANAKEQAHVLRDIKRICDQSKSQYIMLANDESTRIPVNIALYWLANSSAFYVHCDKTLINHNLPISRQPIEHIEANLYALCTDFHPNIDNAWCGLFRKDQLKKFLKGARSLKRLNKNIIKKLYSKNRAVLGAVQNSPCKSSRH